MSKISVYIVDDSAYVRGMLRSIINSQADMSITGSYGTADEAAKALREVRPDVMLLSMDMADMADLTLLERLVHIQDTQVVLVSSQMVHEQSMNKRAMELGVVGFVGRPKASGDLGQYGSALCDVIRTINTSVFKSTIPAKTATVANHVLPPLRRQLISASKLLVIGASTGGTEALKDLLIQLPADSPGIVIAQHMPEGFTQSFALRLNSLCQIKVKEAEHGDRIQSGHAYVAPGHSHLLIKRREGQFFCELSQAPPVNRHRPSVDVLFHSVAKCAKSNAVGIILTGMGRDGAEGMLAMHQAGAYNFAQDEASCVVFGMPKEAIANGSVGEVVALPLMAERIMTHLRAL